MYINSLSDNGVRTIEILFKKHSEAAFSTGRVISTLADVLFDHCVLPQSKGGSITPFSKELLSLVALKDCLELVPSGQ